MLCWYSQVEVWSIYDHPDKFGAAAGSSTEPANEAAAAGSGHGHGHGGAEAAAGHGGHGHAHGDGAASGHGHGGDAGGGGHGHGGAAAAAEGGHGHGHSHGGGGDGGGHGGGADTGPMRGYPQIETLLRNAQKLGVLPACVISKSLEAFHKLAVAEASVHGMTIQVQRVPAGRLL